jgi:hypothetical protein
MDTFAHTITVTMGTKTHNRWRVYHSWRVKDMAGWFTAYKSFKTRKDAEAYAAGMRNYFKELKDVKTHGRSAEQAALGL